MVEARSEQALVKIFGGRAPAATASEATPAPAPADLTGSVKALGQRALEIYSRGPAGPAARWLGKVPR
jgi:hypothetical protein